MTEGQDSTDEVVRELKEAIHSHMTALNELRPVVVRVLNLADAALGPDDERDRHARALLGELIDTLAGLPPSESVVEALRGPLCWLEQCEHGANPIVVSGYVKGLSGLRNRLARIDSRAANLTDDQIRNAFARKQVTSIEGVAARLMIDCGAFDCAPGDFSKAKRRIELARKRLRGL